MTIGTIQEASADYEAWLDRYTPIVGSPRARGDGCRAERGHLGLGISARALATELQTIERALGARWRSNAVGRMTETATADWTAWRAGSR